MDEIWLDKDFEFGKTILEWSRELPSGSPRAERCSSSDSLGIVVHDANGNIKEMH